MKVATGGYRLKRNLLDKEKARLLYCWLTMVKLVVILKNMINCMKEFPEKGSPDYEDMLREVLQTFK